MPYPTITREIEVIVHILQKDSKPALSQASDVPAPLRALLERCWERDPKRRIAISDVLERLRQMVSTDLAVKSRCQHSKLRLRRAVQTNPGSQ